jgi:hypothetical protein
MDNLKVITDEHSRFAKSVGPAETAMNIISVLINLVPWFGGAVGAVLSGIIVERKLERVREVLEGVATDLKDFKSEASESYVKAEDFQELLERTVKLVAEERSEEKRLIYRGFLTDAIKSPGQPYDEQIRFLRILESLQGDHIKILKAMSQTPPKNPDIFMGTQGLVLCKRLNNVPADRVDDMVTQLNDLRVTSATSLHTLMSGHGAEDLRSQITPLGERFLRFIVN